MMMMMQGLDRLHTQTRSPASVVQRTCTETIKEARKEWHPPEEVFNHVNTQSRHRGLFIQLPDVVGLHCARIQAKILKGAKENKMETHWRGMIPNNCCVSELDCIIFV